MRTSTQPEAVTDSTARLIMWLLEEQLEGRCRHGADTPDRCSNDSDVVQLTLLGPVEVCGMHHSLLMAARIRAGQRALPPELWLRELAADHRQWVDAQSDKR